MKKITLIGICLIIALIGVSCVLTAGSLTNTSANNSSTNGMNTQQQNSIQNTVMNKTAEISKIVQNNVPKIENKNTTVKSINQKSGKLKQSKQHKHQSKSNK